MSDGMCDMNMRLDDSAYAIKKLQEFQDKRDVILKMISVGDALVDVDMDSLLVDGEYVCPCCGTYYCKEHDISCPVPTAREVIKYLSKNKLF